MKNHFIIFLKQYAICKFIVFLTLTCLLLSTIYTTSYAQQPRLMLELYGKITDKAGKPIPGVSISVKGTNLGASTDIDGNYRISFPSSAKILSFSFIGMKTQEFPATSGEKNIIMSEDKKMLGEVVILGYTSQRRESLTGSLKTIGAEKLQGTTSPSVENLLSGKVAGVFVAPGSGRPGDQASILIRGKSTINSSVSPLWVVDGIVVGNNPGWLAPANIKKLTVLKDAASTAIYGSRGSNGVIVVTTKNPKVGNIKMNMSAKGGLTTINNGNIKMMNSFELYRFFKSFSNVEKISFPRWNDDLRYSNFDWWDLASQTGIIQDYNFSISGGSKKIKSLFSSGIYHEKGAVKGYNYTKYNFLFKTNFKPFEWLSIKPSIYGIVNDIDNRQYSVGAMYSMLPWDSPYDKDGNIVKNGKGIWVNSNSINYLYDLQWNFSKSKSYNFAGSLNFDIKFTDWLSFSSSNSFSHYNSSSKSYSDPRSPSVEVVKGRISEYRSSNTKRYTSQILRFKNIFDDKHAVDALLGYEFNDLIFKYISAKGTGFVPGFEILNVTSKPESTKGDIGESVGQSFFSNINYAYNNKYLTQLSLRTDGASKFGKSARYGTFFSISGGWNIHQEKFFDMQSIDALKLRMSFGSTGNTPPGYYSHLNLYSVKNTNYNEIPGAIISQIGNDFLAWEKTYTTGIGLDATLFNRFNVNLDIYNKNTSNLLYNVPVSGLTGVTSIVQNMGELRNRGIEINLSYDILKHKETLWNFNINFGINKNKIIRLYKDKSKIIVGDGSGIAGSANIILKPGLSADSWYLKEWAGVNIATGAPQWYKTVKDNNGNINKVTTSNYAEASQVVVGSYNPDFFGGFSSSLKCNKLDANIEFSYSVGGKIYNYTRQEYDSDGAYSDRNQIKLRHGWNRWRKPGDIATHPLPSYNNPSNSNKVSSRYLEDGSYLKLRNLSIGYSLQLPKYKISNLRIYISGENLLTLTKYSGIDPEIPLKGGRIIGTTTTTHPSVRKFILGVNLTF